MLPGCAAGIDNQKLHSDLFFREVPPHYMRKVFKIHGLGLYVHYKPFILNDHRLKAGGFDCDWKSPACG